MSFDDMIKDDGAPAPTVCDDCAATMENTAPDPIKGWPLLVFDCERCEKQFCQHLDAADGGNVCPGCVELQKAGTRWPIVPAPPIQQDGTAADTSRSAIEYAPPGHGWRIAGLLVLVALVFVGMCGAVLMFSRHGGR